MSKGLREKLIGSILCSPAIILIICWQWNILTKGLPLIFDKTVFCAQPELLINGNYGVLCVVEIILICILGVFFGIEQLINSKTI